MHHQAKIFLTAAQLAAFQHLAIDLAQKRGVRRIAVCRLMQEAIVDFLQAHGVEPDVAASSEVSS